MSAIPVLLLAAVEALLSRRDPKAIAKEAQVDLPDLKRVCVGAYQRSWQARYALAIADSSCRPDHFAIIAHLARVEKLHEDLMTQYQHARQTCDYIRSHDTLDVDRILKADSLAFRIHQSAARAQRDLQKLEIRLENAEKAPEEPAQGSTPSARRNAAASGERKSPEETPEIESAPTTDNRRTASEQAGSEQATSEKATNNQPLATPPTADELESCIIKHRHRIKDTPAKDRPALVARLLEQERIQKQPTAAAA